LRYSLSAPRLQEAGATGLQYAPNDIWKMICGLNDDSYLQNEHVPLREGRRAFCQLRPRNQESLLQGSLLAIPRYVQNEVRRVSFRHQQPVSGEGQYYSL